LLDEFFASAVKNGVGETLTNGATVFSLDNLKQLIDKWSKVMQNTIL